MLTRENAPWIEYLEINEETNERTLILNAPDEVKEAYRKHQVELQKHNNNETKIPK